MKTRLPGPPLWLSRLAGRNIQILFAPAQKLMQRERHFVGMRRAPRHDTLELEGIVRNCTDFHQLGLDDIRVAHRS